MLMNREGSDQTARVGLFRVLRILCFCEKTRNVNKQCLLDNAAQKPKCNWPTDGWIWKLDKFGDVRYTTSLPYPTTPPLHGEIRQKYIYIFPLPPLYDVTYRSGFISWNGPTYSCTGRLAFIQLKENKAESRYLNHWYRKLNQTK